MANSAFFKQAKSAFDELSINGFIGSSHGQMAYVYIRVSSEEQADDNRSGLARQITHCHEIAIQKGYRIPWELVFADDDSGFEFENRSSLLALRREIKLPYRRANVVVMEVLDRLSRNADWHQGFLLDEMKRNGIEAVFWKPFTSRIERAVMGAVAQDAMELAIERMYEGLRSKARSGRVTSRTRAYGYKFVDSMGQETPNARKETYYAIYESEAEVVERIFAEVASGKPIRRIAADLTGVYPSPRGKQAWGKSTINCLIKSPNYKGEFHAFRWSKDREGHNIEYDNYIVVPIPAIVSVELWDAANRMLEKNRQTAVRNAKTPYLLTGLVKCATCGLAYTGHNGNNRVGGEKRQTAQRDYRCSSQSDPRRKEIGCNQGKIGCKKLDDAVWTVVCLVLLEPKVLNEALEEHFSADGNEALLEQIAYLEEQINNQQGDDNKLYHAYLAGAFDEYEYAAQRRTLKELTQKLRIEVERLRSSVLTWEQREAQKQLVFDTAERLKQIGDMHDIPFEVKQRIIKMVVNRIVLSTKESWFKLEGAVAGTYSLLPKSPNEPDGKKGAMKSSIVNSNAPIPDLAWAAVAGHSRAYDKPVSLTSLI